MGWGAVDIRLQVALNSKSCPHMNTSWRLPVRLWTPSQTCEPQRTQHNVLHSCAECTIVAVDSPLSGPRPDRLFLQTSCNAIAYRSTLRFLNSTGSFFLGIFPGFKAPSDFAQY